MPRLTDPELGLKYCFSFLLPWALLPVVLPHQDPLDSLAALPASAYTVQRMDLLLSRLLLWAIFPRGNSGRQCRIILRIIPVQRKRSWVFVL